LQVVQVILGIEFKTAPFLLALVDKVVVLPAGADPHLPGLAAAAADLKVLADLVVLQTPPGQGVSLALTYLLQLDNPEVFIMEDLVVHILFLEIGNIMVVLVELVGMAVVVVA
jgi:hypothetical protein